jgi:hypothetical protein
MSRLTVLFSTHKLSARGSNHYGSSTALISVVMSTLLNADESTPLNGVAQRESTRINGTVSGRY